MIKAGITGGIGSGKTTVCRIFEFLGVPVYYADDRAKYLMQHDEELIKELKECFGTHIYDGKGRLKRAELASLVFNDRQALEQLNALVHPRVAADSEAWNRSHSREAYTLKEAALLFESGSYAALDQIIVVTAPVELRIERIIQRDGASRQEVLNRMKNQWEEEEKVKRADFIIRNDEQHGIIPQILQIHRALSGKTR